VSRRETISIWAPALVGALLALAGACRSRDKVTAPATTAANPGTKAVPRAAALPAAAPSGTAAVAHEITVQAKGQPWIQINARGETLTVVTESGSLVGRPRDDGKRKYAPAEGGAVLIEVKPRAANEAEAGELAMGFKLRGPDGKLLWKVKAGPAKVKVAAGDEDGRAFVASAKDPTEVAVLAPDGLSIGRVRALPGTKELRGEDATGAELFRTPADLPPAFFGVLLFQGMPLTDRAVILAELAARMAGR